MGVYGGRVYTPEMTPTTECDVGEVVECLPLIRPQGGRCDPFGADGWWWVLRQNVRWRSSDDRHRVRAGSVWLGVRPEMRRQG